LSRSAIPLHSPRRQAKRNHNSGDTQPDTTEVKTALDRIAAAAGNPDEVKRLVTEAKTKLDKLVKDSGM
jgi:hypothetical protein